MQTQIVDIFHNVQRRFRYIRDSEQFAKEEFWNTPEGTGRIKGDCEDFALACRKLCREAGIKSRLVLCRVETGEMHCVLECGGMVLDVRQKHVLPKHELNYTWLAISGYEAGDDWQAIKQD